MLTAAALTLLVNALTALIKWTDRRFGRVGTQMIVFGLSLVAAVVWTYQEQIPGFKAVLAATIGIFCLAVTFYEVVLNRVAFFKGPGGN